MTLPRYTGDGCDRRAYWPALAFVLIVGMILMIEVILS